MEGVESTHSQQPVQRLPPLGSLPDPTIPRPVPQLPPHAPMYPWRGPSYPDTAPYHPPQAQPLPVSAASSGPLGSQGSGFRPIHHEKLVGAPGYPEPTKARGPKARFTADDDSLLRHLKEDFQNPKLSWKQIADFFPDRASGTLQVRYCTKLRKKDDFSWSGELDGKLRQAVLEVEKDKWRQVAVKVGKTGLNAKACEERFEMLEAFDAKERGEGDGDDL